MNLCPNCNKPFEEKYGKLFCADHGWHDLNEVGEIIPGVEPTPDEVAAWESTQQPPEPEKTEQPAETVQVEAERVEIEPIPSFAISEKRFLVLLCIAGVVVASVAGYRIYLVKRQKDNKVEAFAHVS